MLIFVLLALAAGPGWTRDFEAATREAADRGRPMLLSFRMENCVVRAAPGTVDALGRPVHGDVDSDCALMEEDVWGHGDVEAVLERYTTVLVAEGADRTVQRRYEVVTLPTALVADPWGNEIVRLVRYVPRDRVLRILRAMPGNFSPAEAAGRALARDPGDVRARVALARFYEANGLREIALRYYDRALQAPAARDVAVRRPIQLARGLNLLHLGQGAEAARVFERELAESPEAPEGAVLMLGQVTALLQAGRSRDAEQVLREMKRRFPQAPETSQAEQNLRHR